jgi:DNA primase
MEDNVSKIKEKLSVVDVVSSYIKVQKAGVNYKARCPFHNEKTPSFVISPERQIWHCFGCSAGGDLFTFVQQIEGVDFPEALRTLAQRAGVELKSFDPRLKDAKSNLFEISETAIRFFEKQLFNSITGKKALEYLKDRGLEEDTIREFRLGFAPNDWRALTTFLKDCGYKEKDIVDSGLAIKKERDAYDRFRSRITFPIFDINDNVVGFTGRIFSGEALAEAAKYINTPQTLIYDKSRILYGLNKAKLKTRREGRCVLVEGNMDVIMSYQAGVTNVVASSGTALTPYHLQILKRYTNNLDFCFDTDQAGSMATRKGIGMALSHDFNVKVIEIGDKECKDPADFVKKYGSKWKDVSMTSVPVLDFYFNKSRSELDLQSSEGKRLMVVSLSPFIKRLVSSVERSHWVSKLATLLRINEDAIMADINIAKDDIAVYESNHMQSAPEVKNPVKMASTGDVLNQSLLSVIVRKPSIFKNELSGISHDLLNKSTLEAINALVKANTEKFNINQVVKAISAESALNLEFAYLKSQELFSDFEDDSLKAEFNNILRSLERKNINAELSGIELDVKEAESTNDKKRIIGLLKKFSELTKKLSK